MLVLWRRIGEAVRTEGELRIIVLEVRGNMGRLGFEGPGRVVRDELPRRDQGPAEGPPKTAREQGSAGAGQVL